MSKHDGGPAFATMVESYVQEGMSLRDWFAGMALMGICANTHVWEMTDFSKPYEYADAMLAERDK